MAQVFGGKKVLNMRHLEPGDKDYDEKEAKVSITLEDGKSQVVKASEVKSADPPPKAEPATQVAPNSTQPSPKMPLDDEDEKPSLGARRK